MSADAGGYYAFPVLGQGSFVVTAESSATHAQASSSVSIEHGEQKRLDLTLGPSKEGSTSSTEAPKFYDEPTFTVSGVTDTTNLGGHGSDTIVHARDSLAKQAVSLGRNDGEPKITSEAAEAELRTKVAKEPSNAEFHHQLADLDEERGRPLEAVREYERAAELGPTESYIFDWGAELLLHHAPEPATEVFNKGNRLFPKSQRMLVGWGAALFARGAEVEAVQRICQASDLTPSDPMPYVFMGRLVPILSSTPNELAERLRRFLELHPDNADANYYYALTLWKRRTRSTDAVEIESLLNTAIRQDPRFAAAYLQLGIVYSDQREIPKAISNYRAAIKFDPRMEEPHYRLAQAYRQIGETEKARVETDEYERLIKQSAVRSDAERHAIRQFVYTLRDQNAPAKP